MLETELELEIKASRDRGSEIRVILGLVLGLLGAMLGAELGDPLGTLLGEELGKVLGADVDKLASKKERNKVWHWEWMLV